MFVKQPGKFSIKKEQVLPRTGKTQKKKLHLWQSMGDRWLPIQAESKELVKK